MSVLNYSGDYQLTCGRNEVSSMIPYPRDGNDSLLLLSYCIGRLDGQYPAIRRWTRSKEGQQWYQGVFRSLKETRSKEQEVLGLTAFTAYEYFSGSVDQAVAFQVYAYLWEELMSEKRGELWKQLRENVEQKLENEWEVEDEQSEGLAEDGVSKWAPESSWASASFFLS